MGGCEVSGAPAVAQIATMAAEINRSVENIGARRLHTGARGRGSLARGPGRACARSRRTSRVVFAAVIEKIMENISFTASDLEPGTDVRAAGTPCVFCDDAGDSCAGYRH